MGQALPEAVRRQAEAVEGFRKEMAEAERDKPASDQSVADVASGAEPATVSTEPTTPNEAEPVKPASTESAEDVETRIAKLERQNATLIGMYLSKAEVPRLQAVLRERDAKIAELEKAKPVTPLSDEDLMKAYDLSQDQFQYGRDLWDGVRSVVHKELEAGVKPIRENLVLSEKQQFYKDLDGKVSDWEMLNLDPDFNVWLNEFDDFRSATKRQLIESAETRLDAPAVSAIFNAFKGSRKSTTPVVSKPKTSLESLVTPKPAATIEVAAGPAKKRYREKEWKLAMDSLTKGDINTPDNQKKLVELRLAVKEQRIDP